MGDEMAEKIIEFVREEYLEDEDQEITGTTSLITSGIVDSFSMVSLKNFLEDEYDITMTDDEASADTFDTVASIVELLKKKLA